MTGGMDVYLHTVTLVNRCLFHLPGNQIKLKLVIILSVKNDVFFSVLHRLILESDPKHLHTLMNQNTF